VPSAGTGALAHARERDLLDVPYVHVVFTLPHRLLPLAYRNSARLYTWLFQASAATLREVAADPRHLGAEIGVLSILHTWGKRWSGIRTCTASCRPAACRLIISDRAGDTKLGREVDQNPAATPDRSAAAMFGEEAGRFVAFPSRADLICRDTPERAAGRFSADGRRRAGAPRPLRARGGSGQVSEVSPGEAKRSELASVRTCDEALQGQHFNALGMSEVLVESVPGVELS